MRNEVTTTVEQAPVARAERVLIGTPVGEPPIVRRLSMTAVLLAAVAWTSTIALAFMLGRASVEHVRANEAQHALVSAAPSPPTGLPIAVAVPAPSPAPSTTARPDYPKYPSTVPAQFRGAWDEIVSDGCEGRETRYAITATTFSNFEVKGDVERVKLLSPTEIELSITGYDDDKNQFNTRIPFRLVDDGKGLTGLDDDSKIYRKCTATP